MENSVIPLEYLARFIPVVFSFLFSCSASAGLNPADEMPNTTIYMVRYRYNILIGILSLYTIYFMVYLLRSGAEGVMSYYVCVFDDCLCCVLFLYLWFYGGSWS